MADRDSSGTSDQDLRDRLVDLLEDELAARRRPRRRRDTVMDWLQRLMTPAAVFISAATLAFGYYASQKSLRESSEQFERTMRQDQYADIVGGLASSSVGVQVNSIRRLVQHVTRPDNFVDTEQQSAAADNASKTLAAFIEDESTVPGHEGLTDYRDPQPVVVSRALDQLIDLLGTEGQATEQDRGEGRSEDRRFPGVAVDLSRGNFHGVNAPDVFARGPFIAVGADFRAASVTGWNLTSVKSPDLSNSFFTCADLTRAELGTANVAGADFTGANLRGADLSEVRNLTSEQIAGALVGRQTLLPPDVTPSRTGWGQDDLGDEVYRASPACRHLMERMTHLLAGAGLSSRLRCPDEKQSRWAIRLSPPEEAALARVCRLRPEPPARDGKSGADAR